MTNNSGRRVRIVIRNRNEAELTEELTTAIKYLLEVSGTALSIEDCSQIAQKQGFMIDEYQRALKEAKEKAQTNRKLLEQSKVSQIKENLLPLQGQLWHHWCKKKNSIICKKKGIGALNNTRVTFRKKTKNPVAAV